MKVAPSTHTTIEITCPKKTKGQLYGISFENLTRGQLIAIYYALVEHDNAGSPIAAELRTYVEPQMEKYEELKQLIEQKEESHETV